MGQDESNGRSRRTAAEAASCLVCAAQGRVRTQPHRVSRVTIEARSITLCRDHAAHVAIHMPETWEELRALFIAPGERRSLIPRRIDMDDRRVFPPRPEGRRRSSGRRTVDPPTD
jgi:hypothetical protein